jgi:hypothetical protein
MIKTAPTRENTAWKIYGKSTSRKSTIDLSILLLALIVDVPVPATTSLFMYDKTVLR